MEDIGDYLYLIIVAIAAIGSFFKNKNKKNEAAPIPDLKEEEMENEYEEEEYEEIPQEIYTPIPSQRPEVVFERSFTGMTTTPHETIMSFENTSDISKLKAKKEITKMISTTQKTTVETMEELENPYSINTVEEARAAFISSEIFNRKY